MSNTWLVRWEGERAEAAAEALRWAMQDSGGVFRCGHAGALWRTLEAVPTDATRVESAQLMPVDPHTVNPLWAIPGAPLPSRVTG